MVMFNRPSLKAAAATLLAAASNAPSSTRTRTARSQTATQTTTKRRKRAGKSNSLQMKMLAMKPAFHDTVSDTDLLVSHKHNTLYAFSPTQAVTQGTTNADRIGDAIFLEALKIKGLYHCDAATGAYTLRILIGYSGEEYNCATSFVTGFSITDIFLPNTGSSFRTSSIVNPKAFTVLYDTTVELNSNLANTQEVKNVEDVIQLKKKFAYQSSGSQYAKDQNLYIIVCSTVLGGTTGVTNAGASYLTYDLIFKNC